LRHKGKFAVFQFFSSVCPLPNIINIPFSYQKLKRLHENNLNFGLPEFKRRFKGQICNDQNGIKIQ
jgi:uncharacterized membrane protein YjgN (DUF898 family)